ncbi:MAG TPA: N-acetylmuramoyl-L-alanine amidase, partial [Fusibacter sp.]|nr:N-acetylmuramoyl-L-alanine amidase [Fusibacter sp.]
FSTDTVVIGTSESPMYNPQINGNQVIVDIVSSYLKVNNGAYQVLPVNKGKIETISYQQLDKSKFGTDYEPTDVITRVTIELSEEVTYDDFYVEDSGSEVLVYISNNPINNFDYVKQSDERGVMSINLFGKTTYTSKYDAASRKITMEIPKDKTDLGSFEQGINDHIVEKFVVSETASTYKIEATLAENTKYVEASSSSAIVFNFTNTVIRDSEHKETLIVIDAGHGGKDPGAVGTKTQEKILTLKASKMLESELQKQGFKVYMTRSNDEYVGLYDRAAIANDLDATLFVSVHINAFTNPNVSGIEVFYGNDSLTSDKGLAKSIQTELIKALGAVDRDIDSKPRLVVLQETKMTSVLAELGFISNPAEQDKMMSEAYLQKAAEAMSRGIINFLK